MSITWFIHQQILGYEVEGKEHRGIHDQWRIQNKPPTLQSMMMMMIIIIIT
jgi:hypothetical protein